jgi:hypothetical protein
VADLEVVAKATEQADWASQILHLPLWRIGSIRCGRKCLVISRSLLALRRYAFRQNLE